MFKKSMLMLSLLSISFVQSNDPEKSNERFWIGFAAASTVLVGTSVYWSCRESNEIKIERAQKLCDFYAGNLYGELSRMVSMQDIVQALQQSTKFKKEMMVFGDLVHTSYLEIKARYGSWIKPWNWTSEMKHSYEQLKELDQSMQLVALMFRYQPFIVDWQSMHDEQLVIKGVQAVCKGISMYPISSCVTLIQQDLQFLRKTRFKVFFDLVLIDMLEKLLESVLSTSAYVAEKQTKEEFLLKERQARAQETQALAQLQQAQAQRERNKIEREKLDKQ